MTAQFHPVTPDRWPDLDRLFRGSPDEGAGNPSRCWCMEWRSASYAEWERNMGEPNRRAMRRLVEVGQVPGILAYIDAEPAGWCSVSPRPALPVLRERGTYHNFGDPSVWVIICFYVPEQRRGQGLLDSLLSAAVGYARSKGSPGSRGLPR